MKQPSQVRKDILVRMGKKRQRWTTKVAPRKPYRKAVPSRWKWRGDRAEAFLLGGSGAGRIAVYGKISGKIRNFNPLRGVSSAELERWTALERNLLPPGEEAYLPMTDEQLTERAIELLQPYQTEADKRSEEIRENGQLEKQKVVDRQNQMEDEADEAEKNGDAAEAKRLRYQSTRLRHQSEEIDRETRVELLRVRDELVDRRAEVHAQVQREQDQQNERAMERVQELKLRMNSEIEDAVNRFLDADIYDLQSWELG